MPFQNTPTLSTHPFLAERKCAISVHTDQSEAVMVGGFVFHFAGKWKNKRANTHLGSGYQRDNTEAAEVGRWYWCPLWVTEWQHQLLSQLVLWIIYTNVHSFESINPLCCNLIFTSPSNGLSWESLITASCVRSDNAVSDPLRAHIGLSYVLFM